jgi:hypothetical protein
MSMLLPSGTGFGVRNSMIQCIIVIREAIAIVSKLTLCRLDRLSEITETTALFITTCCLISIACAPCFVSSAVLIGGSWL